MHWLSPPARYFLLVTTANRLYQFQGHAGEDERPLLAQVVNADPAQQTKFLELPSSLRAPSTLFLCYQPKERGRPFARHPLFPASFGWLTEPGVYHGRIEAASSGASDTVTVDCQLLNYPAGEGQAPNAMLMTAFHAVLVYDTCVKGICLLNQQVWLVPCNF